MKTHRSKLSRWIGPAVAVALLASATTASAVDLKAVGNAFKDSLFGEVKACRSKITGLNLGSAKAVLGCVVGALKNAAKQALVMLAKSLFRSAVGLLKTNAPAAKQKIQELVNKLGNMLPVVKNFARPVLAAIDRGSSKFVDQVSACESHITSISVATLKSVFDCTLAALKGAGKAAVSGLAVGLFDEFINLLRTNAPAAKSKLKMLADKLPFAPVKALAGSVVDGIGAGSKKFVDEAASCRSHITGFNLESAQNTFGCLKKAFGGAIKLAGVAVVKSLWGQFMGLIEKNCGKAAGMLSSLVGKLGGLFAPAKGLASTISGALTAGCQGVMDKVAALNPVK